MNDASRPSNAFFALVLAVVVWIFACENPLSPELCGTIPEQTIAVGETVDLQLCFEDPNGETLAYEAFSSDPDVATAVATGSRVTVTAVAPGTALVTAVATDPTGLNAQQSFQVVVPDRPPTAVGTIDDRELMVGDSAAIDVAGYFSEPDGQPLRYSAAASDPDALAVSADGTVVTVVAVAKGTVVVTVTATDPGGLVATQRFEVRVPNRPPVAVDSITAREVMVDDAHTLELVPFFSDPDGDPLTYSAAVSDSAVVRANVADGALTLTGLAKGEASVTITAADDEGLTVEQSFTVTVPNRPPLVTDTIPSRMLYKSEADTLDLAAWFSDPDGDPLTWAAEAADASVVALEVSASAGTLVVTPLAEGETVVTVTATDPDGLTAAQGFTVIVPNRPPVATDKVPPRTLYKSEADTLDLTAYFSDPDGDPLTYAAAASNGNVVALEISSSDRTLIVTPISEGETVVTITATDPEGLTTTQSFAVTVPNRGPVATDSIPAQTLYKRETVPLDLTRYFSDPDGDVLQYEIESTDTLVATAAVTGTTLTVRAGVKGEATLAVTATDPGGLTARQDFAVTVLNRAPTVTTPIPALTIFRGPPHTMDMSAHFGDPDGDTLSYSASSSNPWVVRVRFDGSNLILTAWSAGTIEVTVIATDPDSLAIQQTFAVTVSNRGPVAVGRFPDLELRGDERLTLPLARYFHDPDRDALTYEASTSPRGIASATTRGSSVTLTGVSDGHTTLTLTATDPEGLAATQTSQITITGQADTPTPEANTPVPVGSIPEQAIVTGGTRTLVVSGYFRDPNGDPLTFRATTSDPAVATASVSGARVTLRGVSSGQTTLTVTATDPGSRSATLSTAVTVVAPGQGPVAVAPIPEQRLEVGKTGTLSVADNFQDPDGGSLDFAAVSSNPNIVTAAASGSDVTLTGISEGHATVTVTATDSDNLSVSQTVSVRVEPKGRAPVAVGSIPRQTVEAGGVAVFNAAPYFREPAGASMRFDATISDATIATISTRGSNVIVRGVAEGSTGFTITATNAERLSATQSSTVDVSPPPPGPEAVGSVPDDAIMAGDSITIAMAPYFQEPVGKPLTYTAGTSHTGIAAATMSGDILTVVGTGRGTATITVVASNPDGRSATQRFRLRVSRIDTGFLIEYGFQHGVTDALEAAVRDAGAYWMSVLSATEFADVQFTDQVACHRASVDLDVAVLDDVGIRVDAINIDGRGGLYGTARQCSVRSGTGQPIMGNITFDLADLSQLQASGGLYSAALHEIGHVLGLGTGSSWDGSLVNPSSSSDLTADTHFPGSRAIAAFNAAGGTSYSGGKVPVENQGDNSHWRQSVMGDEVMTPVHNLGGPNPLSAITIQALSDLGYRVNVSLADSYAVPSPSLAADIAEDARVIDLSGDVLPGPIKVVDEEGNVVRVIGEEATRRQPNNPPR